MCLNRRASLLLFSLYVHCFVMMEVVFVFVFVSFLVCLFCLHDSIIVFGHFCVGHPTLSSYSGATRVFFDSMFPTLLPKRSEIMGESHVCATPVQSQESVVLLYLCLFGVCLFKRSRFSVCFISCCCVLLDSNMY